MNLCIYKMYIYYMAKSPKQPISIRLAPAVLQWFRSEAPEGYQALIHSVLEKYVEERRAAQNWTAGRAQEIFRTYYAQCFWHYDKDLQIGPQQVPLVVEGLRKYGGREGYILAEELCR